MEYLLDFPAEVNIVLLLTIVHTAPHVVMIKTLTCHNRSENKMVVVIDLRVLPVCDTCFQGWPLEVFSWFSGFLPFIIPLSL